MDFTQDESDKQLWMGGLHRVIVFGDVEGIPLHLVWAELFGDFPHTKKG